VTDINQLTLEQLEEAIHSCTLCPLHQGRTQAVPGEGPPGAEIMFVGEGPGFHEDRQGRPFVGAAGQFLEELLASIGMTRDQVFIANVIKCRPPGNRDPLPNELSACEPYLERQIQLIKPKVIVTLGRFSMYRYMFHPAAALHQPKWRPLVEADFKKLPGLIAEAQNYGDEEPPPQAQQLSLF
jgi:uracil-DNA glycosylase